MTNMNIISLQIPTDEYYYLLDHNEFNDWVSSEIVKQINACNFHRIFVFGRSKTGKCVQKLLKDSCIGFVDSMNIHELKNYDFDAIFLATSPLHYPVIKKKIISLLPDKNFQTIELFQGSYNFKINLIFETQPRSGTNYTVNNLVKCCNWGYADVFQNEPNSNFLRSPDGRFRFIQSTYKNGYIVKAHFTKTLHYPEYRFVKTLFQISYIFDSYYSWGRSLAEKFSDRNYKLEWQSEEWQILQGFIDLNRKWLDYINNKFFLRYEDYYLNFENTIHQLKNYLGVDGLNNFEKPIKNRNRMYWSNDYNKYIDRKVMTTLVRNFYPFIENIGLRN